MVRTLLSGVALTVSGFLATLAFAPATVLPAAGAATCSSSSGVSVVVDFRELGQGLASACVAEGGGKSAAVIFAAAGVDLTYAARQPGFVCRVNGAPSSDECVNASPPNAYWGLWWTDGTGQWIYSSSGVGGLTVPSGGSVGWAWQQDRPTGGAVPPGIAAPVTKTASPSPSATPSPTPSASPSPTATPSDAPTSTATAAPGGTGDGSGSGSGSGSGDGSGSASGGGKGAGSTGPTPSSNPTAPAVRTPEGSESGAPSPDGSDTEPSTGTVSTGPGGRSGTRAGEPSASQAPGTAEGGDSSALQLESLGDSTTTAAAAEDAPTRIPAALTWGILAALVIGIIVTAALARRRRQA